MNPFGTEVDPLDPQWTLHPSRWLVARAVGQRLIPALIEATVIPMTLFYATLLATGTLAWALVAGLAWSYSAVVRRVAARRAVPALIVLSALGMTVRMIVFLLNRSSFVYFAQPILGTVVTAAAFAISAMVGRPFIARFAHDFCRMSPEIHGRPAISRHYRRLTLFWAGINLTSAVVSIVLLLTLPVSIYVGTRTVALWAVTCTGVLVTVFESVKVARREGLATAIGPRCTLHAYAVATTPVGLASI